MPYVLPTPEPRIRWYNDYATNEGMAASILLKALLAQAGAGGGPFAPKNIPNPSYGQTGSPGTSFSLAGANPNPLTPPSQTTYQAPRAASPYATQPLLNQQQFQTLANLQQYQQQQAMNPLEMQAKQLANQQTQKSLDPNSPLNQFLLSESKKMLSSQNGQIPQLQAIADKADAGDAEAQAFMDYLLKH